jgi:hypothetical protein
MDFQIIRNDGLIRLAVAHHGVWTRGVAMGAYAGQLDIDGEPLQFWGYGGIKNTETLYFLGITHALNEVFARSQRDDYRVTLLVLTDGFKYYMTKYMPKWIANDGKTKQGKTPDSYNEIKECYNLYKMGGLDILHLTPKREGTILQTVNQEAQRIAKIASDRCGPTSVGSFTVGDRFDQIN